MACEIFVELLQVLTRMNASEAEIVHLLQEACILLHIEDKRVRATDLLLTYLLKCLNTCFETKLSTKPNIPPKKIEFSHIAK